MNEENLSSSGEEKAEAQKKKEGGDPDNVGAQGGRKAYASGLERKGGWYGAPRRGLGRFF